SMQAHMTMRRELARDLGLALQEEQFLLLYQPIVELDTGRISKVECLVRWSHPTKGMLGPGVFVPFAEDTGIINEMGEWVFREAVRQMSEWRNIAPTLQAGVNVSPVQFAGRVMCPDVWLAHLEDMGMNASSVVVEITERMLMDADDHVRSKLIAFRDAGVQVALDDFGTGYSSMSYLKRFDIDYIKIDQSFVRNLAPGSEDMVLCEAMIVMAHRLGLQVVAEGVETVAQRELLQAAGCDYAQGYLFSRPVDAESFEAMLRVGHIAPARTSRQNTSIGRLPQSTYEVSSWVPRTLSSSTRSKCCCRPGRTMPLGAMAAVMPVFVARSMGRGVSSERMRAICRCWRNDHESPNHARLLTFTNRLA